MFTPIFGSGFAGMSQEPIVDQNSKQLMQGQEANSFAPQDPLQAFFLAPLAILNQGMNIINATMKGGAFEANINARAKTNTTDKGYDDKNVFGGVGQLKAKTGTSALSRTNIF